MRQFGAPQGFGWSALFAGSLTAAIVFGSFWGWVEVADLYGQITWDNAIGVVWVGLGAVSQLGCNLFAIHGRRAWASGGFGSLDFLGCGAGFIVCALYTHAGLENAWALSEGRFAGLAVAVGGIVPVMLWVAPLLEPFVYWRLEKERDRAETAATQAQREESERVIREATARAIESTQRLGMKGARAMGRALRDADLRPFADHAPQVMTQDSGQTQRTPTPSEATDRKAPTFRWPPETMAKVVELRPHRSWRAIEQETGVPHETARRKFDEWRDLIASLENRDAPLANAA